MLIRLLFLTLLLTGFSAFPAEACERGNPRSNNYIRRDDNRCEGIRPRSVVSGSVELISLATTEGNMGSRITIRVPRLSSTRPSVLIREVDKRYQLDQMELSRGQSYYSFTMPNGILSRVGIMLRDLRATAITGSQVVYVPVILQQPSTGYRFVFYSSNSVRFIEADIQPFRGGQSNASWGAQNSLSGEKIFEWSQAIAAPAGRYKFSYVAEIEQRSGPPERIRRSIVFEHNPQWLR